MIDLADNEYILVKGIKMGQDPADMREEYLTWQEPTENSPGFYHFSWFRQTAYRFRDPQLLIRLIGKLHLFHASTSGYYLYPEIYAESGDGKLRYSRTLNERDIENVA